MATTHEWTRLGDEIMDSRDLIAVADEIRDALDEEDAEARTELVEALEVNDEDEAHEILDAIDAIDAIADSGIPDWEYGAALIREDHFPAYAEELAADIGAIDRDAGWPLSCIDWDAAADALRIG